MTGLLQRIEGGSHRYACSHCGYSPENTARWCALGCGSDYNRMVRIETQCGRLMVGSGTDTYEPSDENPIEGGSR